jgi:DNA (cytosine-5)-methyltransferase 1
VAVRLLDLYCGAGGAAAGYARAGFDVVGVDIEWQPNYRGKYHRGDAIEFVTEYGHEFDVITASPPCHLHSTLRHTLPLEHGHVDLVAKTRGALKATGKPYVIENVPDAPLIDPVMLCGSMFGLGAECADGQFRQLRRHRLFESNMDLSPPRGCLHFGLSISVHGGGTTRRTSWAVDRRGGYQGRKSEREDAMRIHWMNRKDLDLAIPPVYTEWLGRQVLEQLRAPSRS